MASLLKGVLIPSPSVAVYGRLAQLLSDALEDGAWSLTNRFEATSGAFSGRVVLVADEQAATKILEALGVHIARS
jgi:hypothetical protein